MKIVPVEDFSRIWQVEGFAKEYQKMFGKSRKEYIAHLENLYADLILLDQNDTDHPQFEKIEDNLYSIRYVSKSNSRVLYTYVLRDGRCILLLPFLEKNSSDYEKGKRRAREQIKALQGGNYEE